MNSALHHGISSIKSLARTKKLRFAVAAVIIGGVFFGSTQAESAWVNNNLTRVTGVDMAACYRWKVCGADLGIPYETGDGSTAYIFGDTFSTRNPEDKNNGWRSPVVLRSSANAPSDSQFMFDSAAGVSGDGLAPEVMFNGHRTGGEFSVIPNDGIYISELGAEIISYQSINNWRNTGLTNWQTNYSGLAVSYDGGNRFSRTAGFLWQNNASNSDPFQMMSMQRDGDYVYTMSVRAGRQNGPIMMQRVLATDILNKAAYQCWNGSSWGGACSPIATGRYGEPSLRKLQDGTWVMSYLNVYKGAIVTRQATSPEGTWSAEKIQLSSLTLPSLYGGFVDPRSTSSDLKLMVSSWQRDLAGRTLRYDVSIFRTSL